uniref:AMP-binding domain-containing protein n=1 Tax=Panagrellus redivivus TaxID=6233 RepID=A0A7E4UTQ3_PANRE
MTAPIERKLFHLQILNVAKKFENEIALLDAETNESYTFGEFRRRSFQLATVISAHLLPNSPSITRDALVCLLPNGIDYPVVFAGTALLGHPLCGISAESTKDELAAVLRKTESRYIVTNLGQIETVRQAIELVKVEDIVVFVFGKLPEGSTLPLDVAFDLVFLQDDLALAPFDDELVETLSARSRALVSLNDTLLLPLSSGTTGDPKMVVLTHANFIAATNSLKKALFDDLSNSLGRRANLAFLPFTHASGFWALCFCLLSGHKTIVMSTFQPLLMMKMVQIEKIDTLNLVPSLVTYLIRNADQFAGYDLSSLRTVLCGSAPISKETIAAFIEKYPQVSDFIQGYGMTELVVLSHLTPLGESARDMKHAGSCGKLLPGFEAKIVDPETQSIITNPNEPGELWLKSEAIMKEYVAEPDRTASVLQDGWFHTGDVVYVDADGYYYVVDRLRNMIKVNGLQVSPVELEGHILTLPYVAEAAVIGIKDADAGQVPVAFVVLKQADISEGLGTAAAVEQIRNHVHDRVSAYKQLRGGIIVLPKLPKTKSGKVIRSELEKIANSKIETAL